MLVLHRNLDESVTLITPEGQRIRIKVASFQRGGVRLGFEASPAVTIVRTELEDQQPQIVGKLLRKQHALSATDG